MAGVESPGLSGAPIAPPLLSEPPALASPLRASSLVVALEPQARHRRLVQWPARSVASTANGELPLRAGLLRSRLTRRGSAGATPMPIEDASRMAKASFSVE